MPDPIGDLVFQRRGQRRGTELYSGGLQADASYDLGDKHTIRGGVMLLDEYLSAELDDHSVSTWTATGIRRFGRIPSSDNNVSTRLFAGVYLQDEWKICPSSRSITARGLTSFIPSFDHENQPSPRVNVIYQPTDTTTLHAGYARYFTPPPMENVPASTVAFSTARRTQSAGARRMTRSRPSARIISTPASAKKSPKLQVGVDGYYKYARKQLDDGLFGQTLILSAFNYAEGRVYGVEFTGSYTTGGFSTYANVAYSVAQGENWNSAQFLFDPTDLAYVKNHWIYLDHDQRSPALSARPIFLTNRKDQHASLCGRALRQWLEYRMRRTVWATPFPTAGPFRLIIGQLGVEQFQSSTGSKC